MYGPQRLERDALPRFATLFDGWDETLIWSCIQGVMGEVYGVEGENGTLLAQAVLADFVFFAGDVSLAGEEAAAALAKNLPVCRDAFILAPENDGWSRVIEKVHDGRCERAVRYATKKGGGFDRTRLQGFLNAVPDGFTIAPVGRELYGRAFEADWSRDLCAQYSSWEEYARNGLGFMALRSGEPVAGASSYSHYKGGIEIEIDTRKDYRRRGLAAACASALILKCLDLGLYPSWDAATPVSVALAEKLGYRFSHEYPVYVVKTRRGPDKK